MYQKLTMNQREALQGVVRGQVPGHLLQKTLPSLITRGLVCARQVAISVKKEAKRNGEGWYTETHVTKYYLTQEGLEVHLSYLKTLYEMKLQEVHNTHKNECANARRVLAPLSETENSQAFDPRLGG